MENKPNIEQGIRLEKVLKYLNMNQSQFARAFGTLPSSINLAISGTRGIPEKVLKDTGMTALAKVLTPFQLRDHARHSSIDMSLLYYHADKMIPEVSSSNFSFLNGLISTQKQRLKIK